MSCLSSHEISDPKKLRIRMHGADHALSCQIYTRVVPACNMDSFTKRITFPLTKIGVTRQCRISPCLVAQIYHVFKEMKDAKKAYPKAFIHIIGFDNKHQVQCISFFARGLQFLLWGINLLLVSFAFCFTSVFFPSVFKIFV